MTELKLGREYYHLQREIMDWCYKNIGNGDWADKGMMEDRNFKWGVSSMFGNTFLTFRDDRDASLFVLKWM